MPEQPEDFRHTDVEICCGSLADAINAQKAKADRIELNIALPLGGLTPYPALLDQVKAAVSLPVICMVRPREGGFCYDESEKQQMFAMAEDLLAHGADGIAFGFLDADNHPDWPAIVEMCSLIHAHGKTAVFHRAFDVCADPLNSALLLQKAGVDRILTSGQAQSAPQGTQLLQLLAETLQSRNPHQNGMEILAGCGLNASNAKSLIHSYRPAGVHASCSDIFPDPAARRGDVSFESSPGGRSQGSFEIMRQFVSAVRSADKSISF